jgi:uncharacterized protein
MNETEQIPEAERLAHRAAVAERLKTMLASAERNFAALPANGISSGEQQVFWLGRIVESREPQKQKILAVWGYENVVNKEVVPRAACRAGCSHCCHVAVLVSKPEAELIAERIGRPLAPVTVQRGGPREARTEGTGRGYDDIPWGYHNPCTFLAAGRCSIYADRPSVCRTYFNMDDDALLCKMTDAPNTNDVPQWDSSNFNMALAHICDPYAQVADIREWFPPEGAE